MGTPRGEAAKGVVARRLVAREENGDGEMGEGAMLRGVGALRWMPGRGGDNVGPDGGRYWGC